jgi:flavin-dependent dehydrogenase
MNVYKNARLTQSGGVLLVQRIESDWSIRRVASASRAFVYHAADNLVSVGKVVHLNYKKPYLSPFEEFQRIKSIPPSGRCSRTTGACITVPQ